MNKQSHPLDNIVQQYFDAYTVAATLRDADIALSARTAAVDQKMLDAETKIADKTAEVQRLDVALHSLTKANEQAAGQLFDAEQRLADLRAQTVDAERKLAKVTKDSANLLDRLGALSRA